MLQQGVYPAEKDPQPFPTVSLSRSPEYIPLPLPFSLALRQSFSFCFWSQSAQQQNENETYGTLDTLSPNTAFFTKTPISINIHAGSVKSKKNAKNPS